jgi:PAS domain S-box-containing protein
MINGKTIAPTTSYRAISSSTATNESLLIELKNHNKNLLLQIKENQQRTERIIEVAKRQLNFQHDEKGKRAAELVIANNELIFQNEEKEKREAELIVANAKLAYQNIKKAKKAAELIVANKELAFQNKEKEKRARELVIVNKELATQIEERVKVEESIRISQSNLKAIIENTDATIYSLDKDLCYITFNQRLHTYMQKMYGLDIKQGDSASEFFAKIGPEEEVEWKKVFTRVLKGESIQFEKKLEGNVFHKYISVSLNPIVKNHAVIGLSCFYYDISKKKSEQEKLSQSEQRYRNIVETAQEGIWITDEKNITNFVNKKLCDLLGYLPSEIISKSLTYFIDPGDKDILIEKMNQVKAGTVTTQDIKFITKSGKPIWTNLSNSPLFDQKRRYVGSLFMVTDITDKILYQESLIKDINEHKKVAENLERMVVVRTKKLKKALQKEKELVDMKSKFIAIASHEFRTPLSTIVLAAGSIKKYKARMSEREIDQNLNTIEKQVTQMNYLLEDVLNASLKDVKTISTNYREVSVDIFKKLATEAMNSSKTKQELQFKMEGKQTSFKTDEKLLRNIIINLITNAVKFSPKAKKVIMEVSFVKGQILIMVKDTGIGIPKGELEHLFTSFSRGSNVGSIEGTGLGLSIVNKAVLLLDGKIKVKSQIEKGTLISVVLPLCNG